MNTTTEAKAAALEAVFKGFADKLRKIASESLSEIEIELLPHLEWDFDVNVENQAKEAVTRFLTGGHDPRFFNWSGYDAESIRAAIYRDHKDEIIAALKTDFEQKIANLNDVIESLRRHY